MITFSVRLPPDQAARDTLKTGYLCGSFSCGNWCNTATWCQQELEKHGACEVEGFGGKPVYSGVIRCNWNDPTDLWTCGNCAGANPAAANATIGAPVVGCAPLGLDPTRPEDQRAACEAVCGGLICGDAPSCRIGVCGQPSTTEAAPARLLARDACTPPPPFNRVAPMGDFRVDFTTGSKLRFGLVNEAGDLNSFFEVGSTSASGFAYLNLGRPGEPTAQSLEFGYIEINGAPFSYATPTLLPPFFIQHPVTDAMAVTLLRASTLSRIGSAFELPAGALLLATRATIDGQPGGAEVLSQGPIKGTFDPVAGTFTLDAFGRNEDNVATIVHLVGTVTNRPPTANAGAARDVECSSPSSTAVVLSGAASSDPDVGDTITHYQWFKHEMRVEPGTDDELIPVVLAAGSGETITPSLPLGEHLFRLHVYDQKLGSGSADAVVRVVDTAPPSLSLPAGVCLWPPNHEFARFEISADPAASSKGNIPFVVNDACDALPTVKIVSVTANEPATAAGSGNTSPDVVFGPTTACVRSERTGSGTGRSYTIAVEARDASGNSTIKQFVVSVPHDMSGHHDCIRATGLSAPDPSCSL